LWIQGIGVKNDMQGKGISTKLLKYIEKYAKEKAWGTSLSILVSSELMLTLFMNAMGIVRGIIVMEKIFNFC